MPNFDDLYTPDFMTPGQIAANRGYAKALMEGAIGDAPVGKSGHYQAVSPMAPALAMARGLYGRYQMNQAGKEEQRRQNEPVGSMLREPIPGEPGAQAQQFAPPATGSPMSSYANATSGQESGGNYAALGNVTRDGDRAYGKYQVMGKNVGPWTQEALGTAMTPQQFLNSPQAQDAVYQKKFGEYVQKYGPEGAARAWFAGPGGMNDMGRSDVNGMTVGRYGQQFAQAAGLGGSPAMAFSGQPQTGGQDPMAMALARPGMQPPGPAMPNMQVPQRVPGPPDGSSGGPMASFFPQRQHVSRETMGKMMTGDVDPGLRQYMGNSYFGQYQPVQMQAPFGGHYVQDAQGNVMFVPGELKNQNVQAGGIHVERPYWVDPSGTQHILGGGAGPVTQGPKASGANTPPATGYDIGGGDNDIGGGNPVAAPKPQSQAEPQAAPNQVAALETGTVSDAPAPGMLGKPPPVVDAGLANKPPAVQTAQAGDGGSLAGMTDQQLINFEQKQELAKERSRKDLERYSTNLDKYQSTARDARTSIPQIELAEKLFNNPKLIQGPFADFKQGYTDFWTGLTNDQQARVSTSLAKEVDKLVASGILSTMRQTLGGLGQIRLAEIELLNRASANRYNTPEVNASILFLAKRLAQRATDIGDITQDYDQGVRWDKAGKRTTSNSDEIPTSTGQNDAINTYMKKHPTLTAQEEAGIEKMLTDDQTRRPRPKAASNTSTRPTGTTDADIQAELQRRQKAAAPAQ